MNNDMCEFKTGTVYMKSNVLYLHFLNFVNGENKVISFLIDNEYTCFTVSVNLFKIVEREYQLICYMYKLGKFVTIARIM
jgi:hypothetical protein